MILLYVSINLIILDTSYKWNYVVCIFCGRLIYSPPPPPTHTTKDLILKKFVNPLQLFLLGQTVFTVIFPIPTQSSNMHYESEVRASQYKVLQFSRP